MELTTRENLIDTFIAEMLASSPDVDRSLAGKLVRLLPEECFETTAEDRGKITLYGQLHEEDAANDGELMGVVFMDRMERAHTLLPLTEPITIFVSSSGGDVELGLAIIGQITRMRREGRIINAHVVGFALSASFDIVQFCDHRTIDPFGGMMMHEAQYGKDADSTSGHLRDAQFSKKLERAVFDVISSRTGRPISYYTKLVDGKDYYVNAPESLAEGFVDEIASIPALPKSPALPAKEKAPRRGRRVVDTSPNLG